MEKNNELDGCGCGNSYTSFYRQYDPRIARWTSIDPEIKGFEGWSPYSNNQNNPIVNADPNGNCPWCAVLAGIVIGAGVDYLAQVAVNSYEGKVENPWADNISVESIVVSGVFGGLTAGVGGEVKTAVQTTIRVSSTKTVVKQTVVSTLALNGAESVVNQLYTNDGNISGIKVVQDALLGTTFDAVATKVVPNVDIVDTKILENQFDRRQRMVQGTTRTSRVNDYTTTKNKLNTANNKNYTFNFVTQTTTGKFGDKGVSTILDESRKSYGKSDGGNSNTSNDASDQISAGDILNTVKKK